MNVFLQPPRVPFLEERTGTIAREWYRYFLDLQERAGGTSGTLVLAPATQTNNAIARWDETTGQLQNSTVTLSDAGAISGATIVASSNTITTEASGGLVATELNAALAELSADIAAISVNPSIYAFAAAYG